MQKAGTITMSALMLTFMQLASGAPKEVKINCSQGKTISDALDKLDDSSKDYILSVSGVCNENVLVGDFQGNSLVLQGDPTATINGVVNSPFGMPVVQLANSRQIVVQNLTINVNGTPLTGNQAGIAVTICSNCNIRNVTVSTATSGITFAYSQGSVLTSTVNFPGTGGAGIVISSSSDVTLGAVQVHGPGGLTPPATGILVDQGATGRLVLASGAPNPTVNGFSTGILVHNNSFFYASTVCTSPTSACGNITGNSQGIRIIGARAFLNGLNVNANPEAGIFLGTGAEAELYGPFAITNTTSGIGLAVSHNSHAAVIGNGLGVTISGTPVAGQPPSVSVGTVSSVRFDAPGTTTVAGFLACDALSAITGTTFVTAPAGNYHCSNLNTGSTPLPQ